jgi:hypothetical protein
MIFSRHDEPQTFSPRVGTGKNRARGRRWAPRVGAQHGIPEGTVLARAKREGWTQQIAQAKLIDRPELARELAKPDAIDAISLTRSVAITMQQRGERYTEGMAIASEKVVFRELHPRVLTESCIAWKQGNFSTALKAYVNIVTHQGTRMRYNAAGCYFSLEKFIVLMSNGPEVARQVGAMPAARIRQFIQSSLGDAK